MGGADVFHESDVLSRLICFGSEVLRPGGGRLHCGPPLPPSGGPQCFKITLTPPSLVCGKWFLFIPT